MVQSCSDTRSVESLLKRTAIAYSTIQIQEKGPDFGGRLCDTGSSPFFKNASTARAFSAWPSTRWDAGWGVAFNWWGAKRHNHCSLKELLLESLFLARI